jgi:cysteine desulfurase
MSEHPIYLDYNATTPVDPDVLTAMLPYLGSQNPQSGAFGLFGNPSSAHAYGKAAHAAVETARGQVADLIGANPDEIVFTGGGSEASNLAIKGVCWSPPGGGFWGRLFTAVTPENFHVVTTAVEHPATAQPADFLRRLGAAVDVVPVDRFGRADPDDVARRLPRRDRGVVTVMHSNNEVGTLMPVREIADRVRRYRPHYLLHTDCAQSLGKVPVDVKELDVDLLSIAGHKLYAPKGVGALYVRRGVTLEPLVHGAGHEAGRRAGTENVPYIVGLGKAAELAAKSLPAATEKLRSLRDRLHERLKAALGERVVLNGHPEMRLPNTLNVNFVGHVGADLLGRVPEVAASTGSACHEGKVSQSPVLCAMRVPPDLGRGAVRLSVGRWSTESEVDRAAEALTRAAKG